MSGARGRHQQRSESADIRMSHAAAAEHVRGAACKDASDSAKSFGDPIIHVP